jgi:hypothetical protein
MVIARMIAVFLIGWTAICIWWAIATHGPRWMEIVDNYRSYSDAIGHGSYSDAAWASAEKNGQSWAIMASFVGLTWIGVIWLIPTLGLGMIGLLLKRVEITTMVVAQQVPPVR